MVLAPARKWRLDAMSPAGLTTTPFVAPITPPASSRACTRTKERASMRGMPEGVDGLRKT